MSSEWRTVRVGDLGRIVTGKTPRTTIKENFGGKIPFLTPSDDMSAKYVRKTKRTLSEQGVAEVAGKVLPANSIAVSCIGSNLGKVTITTTETVTNQQINSIIPFESYYDTDFVYYAIKILGERLNFLSKTSTAVPIINKTQFSNETIRVPPLPIQKAISGTLACLDAKIEINNRITANLEQQAQAIFKSWFVDFEPFQDSDFVESQYGWIPQGWRLGRLGEFIEVTSGKRPIVKTNQRTPNNKVPVIGASRVMGYTNESLFDDRVLVIGRVGTHGVVQRIDFPCWPSDNTLVIKSQFYEFAYQVLKRIDYSSINRGSTQPLITQRDLRNQVIVVPPESVLRRYEDVASSLLEVVRNNLRENQTLSSLRDTLLPKLMSGEIEVPIV